MADLTKPMYGYWKKQPEKFRDILACRKSLVAEFVEVYRAARPDRLYLVGSGTSLNACRAAAEHMSGILGIEVSCAASSRIPAIYAENPMFVFLSQGGSSTNTLAAMERLGQWPYVTITGEEESEIRRRSAHHMFIGCGAELAGPKTVGYTSSVLNLTLCALESALETGAITRQGYDDTIAVLERAADNMEENIRRTEAWFERNRETLLGIQKYVIVGKASSADAAAEGALKMLETVKVPVLAFEFDEYLHGPLLMTDTELAGMFFITEDKAVKPRMLEFARRHAQFSKYTFLVSGDENAIGENDLHLVITGSALTECYEYVLAPQLVSARVPVILGLPAGAEIFDSYAGVWNTKYLDGR